MFHLVINHRYLSFNTMIRSSPACSWKKNNYRYQSEINRHKKKHAQTSLTTSSISTHFNISRRVERIKLIRIGQLLDDSVDNLFVYVVQMLLHFQACLYSSCKFGKCQPVFSNVVKFKIRWKYEQCQSTYLNVGGFQALLRTM